MIKKLFIKYGSNIAFILLIITPIIGHIVHSNKTNDPEHLEKTLNSEGYTNIIIGENVKQCPSGSGKHPSFHRAFKATNENGVKVQGVICGTWYNQVIKEHL